MGVQKCFLIYTVGEQFTRTADEHGMACSKEFYKNGIRRPTTLIATMPSQNPSEIAAPEQQHLGADELRTAMVAILDKSFPVFHDVRQTAETSEIQIAQPYWFRCPTCKFDWPTWLKPSIIFVSLSFVTDECPNCRRKHVPAYKIGSDY